MEELNSVDGETDMAMAKAIKPMETVTPDKFKKFKNCKEVNKYIDSLEKRIYSLQSNLEKAEKEIEQIRNIVLYDVPYRYQELFHNFC